MDFTAQGGAVGSAISEILGTLLVNVTLLCAYRSENDGQTRSLALLQVSTEQRGVFRCFVDCTSAVPYGTGLVYTGRGPKCLQLHSVSVWSAPPTHTHTHTHTPTHTPPRTPTGSASPFETGCFRVTKRCLTKGGRGSWTRPWTLLHPGTFFFRCVAPETCIHIPSPWQTPQQSTTNQHNFLEWSWNVHENVHRMVCCATGPQRLVSGTEHCRWGANPRHLQAVQGCGDAACHDLLGTFRCLTNVRTNFRPAATTIRHCNHGGKCRQKQRRWARGRPLRTGESSLGPKDVGNSQQALATGHG